MSYSVSSPWKTDIILEKDLDGTINSHKNNIADGEVISVWKLQEQFIKTSALKKI